MLTASLGVLSLGLGASQALGRPMDPALSRLVIDPGCVVEAAPAGCLPDRAAYHKLVSQWGFALAPHSVHAARTTGLAGFNVSLLAAFTGIDNTADYWRRGTQGEGAGSINLDPAAWLQLYSLEMRKGFGFGIEAAGSIGVMPGTSLVSWGADLRVALLEGMRHGRLRYLPDTSLGVGLREATGLGELALGTLAFDARVSRPFVAPSGFVVTPWLGYQLVRIAGDTELVDLTPGIDPLAECGFVGANVPGAPAGVAVGAPAASRRVLRQRRCLMGRRYARAGPVQTSATLCPSVKPMCCGSDCWWVSCIAKSCFRWVQSSLPTYSGPMLPKPTPPWPRLYVAMPTATIVSPARVSGRWRYKSAPRSDPRRIPKHERRRSWLAF